MGESLSRGQLARAGASVGLICVKVLQMALVMAVRGCHGVQPA